VTNKKRRRRHSAVLTRYNLIRTIRFSRGDVIISRMDENWTTISSDAHFADDHLSVVTERVRTYPDSQSDLGNASRAG
jgi:hypothetical protein